MTTTNQDKKRSDESLRKVMKNLTDAAATIKTVSIQGLITCAIIIRRDMEKTEPKTPVDTGNLRHSFFITTTQGIMTSPKFTGDKASQMSSEHKMVTDEALGKVKTVKHPVLILGYSANYALWVHENITAQFSGRPKKPHGRPGSGAKWFEYAIQRNSALMLKTMAKEMKI